MVVVDKEPGWTSHDVVSSARKILGTKRIGHAGTLDPDATGVLVLGVGAATRLLRFVTDLPKSYVGELVLGVATSTLDASGEVVGTWNMEDVSVADLARVASCLTGEILQVPPMVSALKHRGRRLYELAREGVVTQRPARPVVVHRLACSETERAGVFRMEVDCSSGTYVRSLAASIGEALGGGAHLRALRRVSVGSLSVSEARPVKDLSSECLLSPATALRDYGRVEVGAHLAQSVRLGRVLARSELGASGTGPWPLVDPGGRLIAVYEARGEEAAKPAVVLAD